MATIHQASFEGFYQLEVGGLMLIGMAFFKLGIFSAARSRRFYLTCIVLALAIGLPIIMYGVHRNFAADWVMSRIFFGSIYNYWGSLFVGMGWVSVIMLACLSDGLQRTKQALGSVGRMALTNYLLHTIICTTIFYGHGFGYFGEVSRVGQILIVFAIWAFQVPFSVWWLRYFRFGPFEWLWRTLSYMRIQPLRV